MNKKILGFGFFVVFLFSSAIAKSEEHKNSNQKLRDSYSICMNQSGGVTANILDCVAEETHFHDNRLNNGYKLLLDKLGDKKQSLINGQRAWLKLTNSNSDVIFAAYGEGTSSSINAASGYLQELILRANFLEDLLEVINL